MIGEGSTRRSPTKRSEYEIYQDDKWTEIRVVDTTKYISREQESELILINQFYTALNAKMTGQVINGVLTGCLLESELKEAYEQFKKDIDLSE